MNIGFDAKRAFQNRTGLGNYSRSLIRSLAEYYPEHRYFLFAPSARPLFQPSQAMQTILPVKQWHQWLKPVWRSHWVVDDLVRNRIDIYHGLSAELPLGIRKSGVRSVVTMHDLIFERYPAQYNPIDVLTYRKKAKYACGQADAVIAISEQTKEDLISFYQVPAEKIAVAYQSCDPSFAKLHLEGDIRAMKEKYFLPIRYFLYVGSVIERKNLMGIVKALNLLKDRVSHPLVVLGDGSKYKDQVKAYLRDQGLSHQVIWLNDIADLSFADLPALYQGAAALLYPSVFEGFGIPILEALWSGTPVITSAGSCFRETGGDAAIYVDPQQPEAIAAAMEQVVNDPMLAERMRNAGFRHAEKFTADKCAAAVMKVYESVWRK